MGVDFSRSSAILIGTSEYAYFPQIPAAKNSVERMQQLLTGPLCEWPESRVRTYLNCSATDNLLVELVRIAVATEDVLFFYYVGHGWPTLREDLCMGLVDTSTDPLEREFTGLLMENVRWMIAQSQARVKIIVLDCCYSGIATENRQGGAGDAEYIAGLARVRGAYTLTATQAHTSAHFELGVNPMTYFTKNLVELVQSGIAEAPDTLTLGQIFPHLRHRLVQQRLPAPSQLNIDEGGAFVFARNATSSEAKVDPYVELEKLRIQLEEAAARELVQQRRLLELSQEIKNIRDSANGNTGVNGESRAATDSPDAAESKPVVSDFFISYADTDDRWAQWIARELEEAGYAVRLRAWDAIAGANWIEFMQESIDNSTRTIAVLSNDYLGSRSGQQEWQAAMMADPEGLQRKLLPVRVENCTRPGLLQQVISVDIFDLQEEEARQRLLDGVQAAVAGRSKPRAPGFPGR
jgi:hypothetical protein